MGVTEDLLVIWLTTDESFTLEMVVVVVLVAIPFAAFAELVIDREDIRPFEHTLHWLGIGQQGNNRTSPITPVGSTRVGSAASLIREAPWRRAEQS